MCAENHHIFDLADSKLECTGVGPNHPRQYAASDANDGHDASEQEAEVRRA